MVWHIDAKDKGKVARIVYVGKGVGCWGIRK